MIPALPFLNSCPGQWITTLMFLIVENEDGYIPALAGAALAIDWQWYKESFRHLTAYSGFCQKFA